ncbi:AAA family ATPase [Singulisphaera sp. PoT]|uniref:AAA family ATPase n=1 Tax=Singulisphaera sp. PoT TaxID=3411797 RepID=UPI003BF5C48B
MEVVLFVGLQGSGKSTFFRRTFASTHVLVSKDLLRNNRRPQRRQMQLLEEALDQGLSVVVDNTNPTVEVRAPIIELARNHGAAVVGYYFAAPIADCLARNGDRSGKARVPEAALYITQKRLQVPTMNEGFDRLVRVNLSPDLAFSVEPWPEEDRP